MTASSPSNFVIGLLAVLFAGAAVGRDVPGPRSPVARAAQTAVTGPRIGELGTGDRELPARMDRLTPQQSGTTALLQAVSVVNDKVVWVSGHAGTWARTTDGGTTWTPGTVPGADTLQFRDVQAFSADEAFLMAAGPGELSRVYHTSDGGKHWALQ